MDAPPVLAVKAADYCRLARGMPTICVYAAQLGFGVIQARPCRVREWQGYPS